MVIKVSRTVLVVLIGLFENKLWIGEVINSCSALYFCLGKFVLDFYSATFAGTFIVSIDGFTMLKLWGIDLSDFVSLAYLLPYLDYMISLVGLQLLSSLSTIFALSTLP